VKGKELDLVAARKALRELPEVAAQETLQPPSLTQVFVPLQHPKALSLDSSIVVGMRGAGKSFWTAVLASDLHRHFVSELAGQPMLAKVKTRVGFGLDEANAQFPNAEVIATLLRRGRDPYKLWQLIVLRHALAVVEQPSPIPPKWEAAVGWLEENTEDADELLTKCDRALAKQGSMLLVLFDAFDRISTDWETVRRLCKEALRLCLRYRSRQSIRLKLFLRPDLEEDAEIWKFPDSSKLRHAKVPLNWRSSDLYGLVLASLGNSNVFGRSFRHWTEARFGASWEQKDGVRVLPYEILDEEVLPSIVETLADRYMGRDKKRGYTYTWIPTHLADAVGRISPRSYLLAFKRAAEVTDDRYKDHPTPLQYVAIQDGVVAASQIRVREVTEDYPWVEPLLEAARGLVVPCLPADLTRMWTDECLGRVVDASTKKLPPRRFTTDAFRRNNPSALIDDLVELGVMYRTEDGRLNVPDIFRVGFGIKRKGGVRPPR
jgi:hypothetical protein